MIYEKRIYENTAMNGDVSYTGCCKIYSTQIFGIAWFPDTLYVSGSPYGRYLSPTIESVQNFDLQYDCENALDKLIIKHKAEYDLLHPSKSNRIL